MKTFRSFITENSKRYSVYCDYVNGRQHWDDHDDHHDAHADAWITSATERCKTFIVDNHTGRITGRYQHGESQYEPLHEVSVPHKTGEGALKGAVQSGLVGFYASHGDPVITGGSAILGAGIGGLWARSHAKKINKILDDPQYSPGTVYRGVDGDKDANYKILRHYPSIGKTDILHLGTGEKFKVDTDELPDLKNIREAYLEEAKPKKLDPNISYNVRTLDQVLREHGWYLRPHSAQHTSRHDVYIHPEAPENIAVPKGRGDINRNVSRTIIKTIQKYIKKDDISEAYQKK